MKINHLFPPSVCLGLLLAVVIAMLIISPQPAAASGGSAWSDAGYRAAAVQVWGFSFGKNSIIVSGSGFPAKRDYQVQLHYANKSGSCRLGHLTSSAQGAVSGVFSFRPASKSSSLVTVCLKDRTTGYRTCRTMKR